LTDNNYDDGNDELDMNSIISGLSQPKAIKLSQIAFQSKTDHTQMCALSYGSLTL